MSKDKQFTASNGIAVDDAFWERIVSRKPTEDELQALREWKNAANVEGLALMYGDPERSKRPEHSGFEAPTIGTVFPKGSTIKHNPDGTVEIIPPGGSERGLRTSTQCTLHD